MHLPPDIDQSDQWPYLPELILTRINCAKWRVQTILKICAVIKDAIVIQVASWKADDVFGDSILREFTCIKKYISPQWSFLTFLVSCRRWVRNGVLGVLVGIYYFDVQLKTDLTTFQTHAGNLIQQLLMFHQFSEGFPSSPLTSLRTRTRASFTFCNNKGERRIELRRVAKEKEKHKRARLGD